MAPPDGGTGRNGPALPPRLNSVLLGCVSTSATSPCAYAMSRWPATSLGSRVPAKETGTSGTKRSAPRRTANYPDGPVAVGDAVLADRAEEHAHELTVAVTPDDDEIGGLRE